MGLISSHCEIRASIKLVYPYWGGALQCFTQLRNLDERNEKKLGLTFCVKVESPLTWKGLTKGGYLNLSDSSPVVKRCDNTHTASLATFTS